MKLNKIPIVRDAGTLVSGNVAAQAINLGAYLILTRLFSPEDYGLYNIFYSYIEVLTILATCKYEVSMVIADSDREAAAMKRFALRLNTCISVALLAVITALYFLDAMPGDSNQLGLIALLIPPMVFFCGTTRIYAAVLNRFHGYRQIASIEVITATGNVGTKILFGFFNALHAVGLPLGTVLGKMAGNISYHHQVKKLNLPHDTSAAEQRAAAKKHRNFPLYVMPKDFLNSFSANLPFLWLALHFGKAEIGLFGLALTFTFRPINLINTAFESVLYARTSEKVRANQSIRKEIWSFVGWASLASLPLFIAAFIFAEPIFTFLFSGKWEGCGYYVRCLLPWVYMMLISTSLMFISNIFSTQRTEFAFYFVLLLLRIAALSYGIHLGSFNLAVQLYAAAGTLITLALLIWYLCQVERYEKRREKR